MSASEAARVLRIIGKYAWAAADEIEGKSDADVDKPAPVDLEAARKEAAARRKRLGGSAK